MLPTSKAFFLARGSRVLTLSTPTPLAHSSIKGAPWLWWEKLHLIFTYLIYSRLWYGALNIELCYLLSMGGTERGWVNAAGDNLINVPFYIFFGLLTYLHAFYFCSFSSWPDCALLGDTIEVRISKTVAKWLFVWFLMHSTVDMINSNFSGCREEVLEDCDGKTRLAFGIIFVYLWCWNWHSLFICFGSNQMEPWPEQGSILFCTVI